MSLREYLLEAPKPNIERTNVKVPNKKDKKPINVNDLDSTTVEWWNSHSADVQKKHINDHPDAVIAKLVKSGKLKVGQKIGGGKSEGEPGEEPKVPYTLSKHKLSDKETIIEPEHKKHADKISKDVESHLDQEYHYGMSKPGSFGEKATKSSVAYTLKAIDSGERDIEKLAAEAHRGWAKAVEEHYPPEEKNINIEENPLKQNTKEINTRGHIKINNEEEEIIKQIMIDTNVDKKEAKEMKNAIAEYTKDIGNGYKNIRNGKKPDKTKSIETLINKSPKWDSKGEVYRGMLLPEKTIKNFKIGNIIDMKGMSSWTSKRNIAELFAEEGYGDDGKSIIFKMVKADSGISISHLSSVDEKEILVSGKTKFKINKIKIGEFSTIIIVEEVI